MIFDSLFIFKKSKTDKTKKNITKSKFNIFIYLYLKEEPTWGHTGYMPWHKMSSERPLLSAQLPHQPIHRRVRLSFVHAATPRATSAYKILRSSHAALLRPGTLAPHRRRSQDQFGFVKSPARTTLLPVRVHVRVRRLLVISVRAHRLLLAVVSHSFVLQSNGLPTCRRAFTPVGLTCQREICHRRLLFRRLFSLFSSPSTVYRASFLREWFIFQVRFLTFSLSLSNRLFLLFDLFSI